MTKEQPIDPDVDYLKNAYVEASDEILKIARPGVPLTQILTILDTYTDKLMTGTARLITERRRDRATSNGGQ